MRSTISANREKRRRALKVSAASFLVGVLVAVAFFIVLVVGVSHQ
jgi:hypothetical protein